MSEQVIIIVEITILILLILFIIFFCVVANKYYKLNTCQAMPTMCTANTSRVMSKNMSKAAVNTAVNNKYFAGRAVTDNTGSGVYVTA